MINFKNKKMMKGFAIMAILLTGLLFIGTQNAIAQEVCKKQFTLDEEKANDAERTKAIDCWVNKVKSGEKKLTGAYLIGADLRNANLTEALLFDANLSNANLTNANLTRAALRRANLSGANLYGANLYGTELSSADVVDVIIRKADILNFLGALNVEVVD